LAKKVADHFGVPVGSLLDEDKEIPHSAVDRHIADAANEATKLFPRNKAAGQVAFEYRLMEKEQKREHAEISDFLRTRARVLKSEAAALEKRARELDAG
jgi:hypothetical protein